MSFLWESTRGTLMLVLLASPPAALGLSAAPRAPVAAGRLQPRTPAIAALAAGSSSALSFEEWAAASGIAAPKLFIDDVQELRGATARAPLAAGEELCRVPRGRTLDLASVAQGESPCPDLAPPRLWSSLAWYERLAVWLLAERELGAASAVSGYISYLPQPGCASFYDAPLHWAEAELRELQYPPARALAPAPGPSPWPSPPWFHKTKPARPRTLGLWANRE